MRFPRRHEGSIDVAGGYREGGEKRMVGEGRGWGEGRVDEAWVRQGSRVDAWVRVRPQERDGDRGHAEEQGLQGGSSGWRGSGGG